MTKKLARLALLTALGLLAAWLEATLLPPLGLPGIKLGLANVFSVLALYMYGFGAAMLATLARVALSALLFGGLSSLLYALSGALLAVPCMALLRRFGGVSCVGASVGGGAAHNLGQIAAAALAAETPGLAAYLPLLLAAGAATGFVNGALALAVRKRFP